MSYRWAVGTLGRPVSQLQRRLVYGVCGLAGAGTAAILALVLGWRALPDGVTVALIVGALIAALVLATASAMRNQPIGAIYFPVSDGSWLDPTGRTSIDAATLGGGRPEHFPGGLVAVTVFEMHRSGRFSAGEELFEASVIVSAPGMDAYLTRILMHLRDGDRERWRPGRRLLGARFEADRPDVAVLPDGYAGILAPDGRGYADRVLAEAPGPEVAGRLAVWDAHTYKLLRTYVQTALALRYQRPDAIVRDIVARRDWMRYLRMIGVFLGAFVITLSAAVMVMLVRYLPL